MKNQRGFGLIEVMIAMGIMSIVMMGIMQLTMQTMLVSATADARASLTSIVQSTAGQAFNQITCTTAITKVQQTYGQPLQFDALKDGTVLSAYRLTVKTLTYDKPELIATAYEGTKVYYGTLRLVATANQQILGGQTFAPRAIAAVYFTVNPAGTIIQCGPSMPPLPVQPTPPPPPTPTVKTLDFDADPKVCENFPIKATCPTGQKVTVQNSSYGSNCGGVPANYGQDTVKALCNGQASCSFTAGNINNCSGQGVFIDPAVGCAKGFHMSYTCQ